LGWGEKGPINSRSERRFREIRIKGKFSKMSRRRSRKGSLGNEKSSLKITGADKCRWKQERAKAEGKGEEL